MFAFLPKDKYKYVGVYKRRCVRDCIERVQRCAIKKQTSSLNDGSSILGRIKQRSCWMHMEQKFSERLYRVLSLYDIAL